MPKKPKPKKSIFERELTTDEIREFSEEAAALLAEGKTLGTDVLNQLSEAVDITSTTLTLQGITINRPNLFALVAALDTLEQLTQTNNIMVIIEIVAKLVWISENQENEEIDLASPPEKEIKTIMRRIHLKDLAIYLTLIVKAFIEEVEDLKNILPAR